MQYVAAHRQRVGVVLHDVRPVARYVDEVARVLHYHHHSLVHHPSLHAVSDALPLDRSVARQRRVRLRTRLRPRQYPQLLPLDEQMPHAVRAAVDMQRGVRVLLTGDEAEVGAVLAVRPHVVLGAVEVLRAVQEGGSGGVLGKVHVVYDDAVTCCVEASGSVVDIEAERVALLNE